MEYIFGKIWNGSAEVETLKTIGDKHTTLDGICHIEQHYFDNIIIDDFTIIQKYKTDELPDGRKLDWYIIDKHSRYIDRFTPQKDNIFNQISDIQELIITREYDDIIDELGGV